MSNSIAQAKFPFSNEIDSFSPCSTKCETLTTGFCRLCQMLLIYRNTHAHKCTKTTAVAVKTQHPTTDQIVVSKSICKRIYLSAEQQSVWNSPAPVAALGHTCPKRPASAKASPPVHVPSPCTRDHLDNHTCPSQPPCALPHLSEHTCQPCKLKHHPPVAPPCKIAHLRDHTCPPAPKLPPACTHTHWETGTPENLDDLIAATRLLSNSQAYDSSAPFKEHIIYKVAEHLANFYLPPAKPSPEPGYYLITKTAHSGISSLLCDLSTAFKLIEPTRAFKVVSRPDHAVRCLSLFPEQLPLDPQLPVLTQAPPPPIPAPMPTVVQRPIVPPNMTIWTSPPAHDSEDHASTSRASTPRAGTERFDRGKGPAVESVDSSTPEPNPTTPPQRSIPSNLEATDSESEDDDSDAETVTSQPTSVGTTSTASPAQSEHPRRGSKRYHDQFHRDKSSSKCKYCTTKAKPSFGGLFSPKRK